MHRPFQAPVSAALLLLLVPALLAPRWDEGVPVTVEVVDAETGDPIPTAVVRHPEERDRHHGGSVPRYPFIGAVLYLPDGEELVFVPGLELPFEVAAPGYVNQRITHVVKKRAKKNFVTVRLEKMDFRRIDEDEDAPVILFKRDREPE